MQLRRYIYENLKEINVASDDLSAETNFILTNLFKVKDLYLDIELTDVHKEKLKEVFLRREKGEPLQYIFNATDFMGEKFIVNSNVLIPRQETELLVLKTIEKANKFESPQMLDLCTGSGCIGVMLAKKIQNALIYASDISEQALELAQLNAKMYNLNLNFIKSDLFTQISGYFDIIVSNPPYIPWEERLFIQKEVRFEPEEALYAKDKNGIEFYEKIIAQAKNYLNKNGYLLFELGINQSEMVKEIFTDYNYRKIEITKDLNGIDRVISARI